MSAATTWDHLAAVPCSAPRSVPGTVPDGGEPARRRHLRLVPTGPEVQVAPRRSRLTRRGRLAVTLLVTAAVLTLAVTMASGLGAPTGVAQPVVTVAPGQTLSEVAAAELPQLPVRDAVVQLQLANGLNSLQVHAGQVLVVPSINR